MINNPHPAHGETWTQSDLRFYQLEWRAIIDLITMKKGLNWIDNQRENLFKMLQNTVK